MPDGSALAFFQFANKSDQDLFDPELTPSPFRHIALNVAAKTQDEIFERLQKAQWKPEGTYVLEHGYCRSLYTEDPNGMLLEFTADAPGAEKINAARKVDAHATLKRWLAHQQQHLQIERTNPLQHGCVVDRSCPWFVLLFMDLDSSNRAIKHA
jgi:hypothetical protein